MAARGTDGMTDMTAPGPEDASAVTVISGADPVGGGGTTGPAVRGGATGPAGGRERTAPAGRGRATGPAGDVRETDPAAEGRETDPAGEGRESDPAGGVRKTDPAGGGRPAGRADSARETDPAAGGRETDPAGDVRKTDPAAGGPETDPAGDVRKTDPSAEGRETDPAADLRETSPAPGAAAPTRAASGVRRGSVPGAGRAIRRLGARAVTAARHGRAVAALLASATVVTTALSLWLGFRVHEQHADEQRRQDILAAARRSALNFTSLDYRHYERDSANVLKGAAGEFKEQFAAQTAELTKLVAANKSVSEGQVLEAGIARSDERTARVLVVADSKVTNSAAPEGQSRTYRLQLDLVLEGGRWLTSNVEFVG
ncbi:DUF4573 domain-containing protein [Streptomyces sp. NPDC059544]|uniref:DUF4573 domain-containing protein n=1 Tax=Streptomyces sp. NPDC059544 TaxID=3346861 RepID=UPI0036A633B8